jgi:hypothetical protein
MTEESETPEGGSSEFEKIQGKNRSLVSELWAFMAENKKWWLLPILSVFLLLIALVVLSTTAAAPFIYTLF